MAKLKGMPLISSGFTAARPIEPPKTFLFRNIASHRGFVAPPDSNAANP
jgi:hypothetical protein